VIAEGLFVCAAAANRRGPSRSPDEELALKHVALGTGFVARIGSSGLHDKESRKAGDQRI
jgi:hypothetical protein